MILALACAASSAHAAEDRYGPARAHPVQVAFAGGGAYGGRMLTWSSRAFVPQAPEPAAVASPVAAPPAPMAAPAPIASTVAPPPELAYARPPQPIAAPPSPPVRAAAAAPAAISPRPEAAPRRTAAAPALPDSLYSPPPPAPAPQRLAQAPPPATAPTEGSHVRLYSVHRQYGLAPDAIPAPPANASNYVLIGVPSDGDKRETADADKPF
jgi:hypothetical protein